MSQSGGPGSTDPPETSQRPQDCSKGRTKGGPGHTHEQGGLLQAWLQPLGFKGRVLFWRDEDYSSLSHIYILIILRIFLSQKRLG